MDRDEIARVLGLSRTNRADHPDGHWRRLRRQARRLGAADDRGRRLGDQPAGALLYTGPKFMASSTKRHPSPIHARAAGNADGRFVAFAMEGDFDTGAYASWGPTVAKRVPVHATGPYRVPNVRRRTRAIYTNGPPSGAFRGFGVPQAAIAPRR